ncbi:MAG: hypothetical protein ABIG68_02290 [Acidobacteriota bacterium]
MKTRLSMLVALVALFCVPGCGLDGGGQGDAVEGGADGGVEPCARPEGECSKGDCIQVCCANQYGSCEHDWGFLEACKLDCAEDPCAFRLLPQAAEDVTDPGAMDSGTPDGGPACPPLVAVRSSSCDLKGLVCTYGETCCPGSGADQCAPEVICECVDECSGLCFSCVAQACQ